MISMVTMTKVFSDLFDPNGQFDKYEFGQRYLHHKWQAQILTKYDIFSKPGMVVTLPSEASSQHTEIGNLECVPGARNQDWSFVNKGELISQLNTFSRFYNSSVYTKTKLDEWLELIVDDHSFSKINFLSADFCAIYNTAATQTDKVIELFLKKSNYISVISFNHYDNPRNSSFYDTSHLRVFKNYFSLNMEDEMYSYLTVLDPPYVYPKHDLYSPYEYSYYDTWEEQIDTSYADEHKYPRICVNNPNCLAYFNLLFHSDQNTSVIYEDGFKYTKNVQGSALQRGIFIVDKTKPMTEELHQSNTSKLLQMQKRIFHP